MEKGMKEPHIEGVAIHDGPESCVGIREGAGEALTGVRVGQAIEPRNQRFGVPTSLTEAEGNIASGVKREPSADPARSKNLGMCGISMRENREIPWSPVLLITGRPRGEGRGRKPEMHDRGKSDSPIVPAKPSNKAVRAAAEAVEGRGLAKGSTAMWAAIGFDRLAGTFSHSL